MTAAVGSFVRYPHIVPSDPEGDYERGCYGVVVAGPPNVEIRVPGEDHLRDGYQVSAWDPAWGTFAETRTWLDARLVEPVDALPEPTGDPQTVELIHTALEVDGITVAQAVALAVKITYRRLARIVTCTVEEVEVNDRWLDLDCRPARLHYTVVSAPEVNRGKIRFDVVYADGGTGVRIFDPGAKITVERG